MIKSVYENQSEILSAIKSLHLNGKNFEADITYGNGSFWKTDTRPLECYDLNPKSAFVRKQECTKLELMQINAYESIVFDPPFLTYIKPGRSIMGKRFSGYWSYDELKSCYKQTLKSCHNALRKGGILVFKCQGIIHNHKMYCTHCNIIEWAEGFRLKDLFILVAKNRMPTKAAPHGLQQQRHARIFHSYFLVLEKP